jgi:hypothetical protein
MLLGGGCRYAPRVWGLRGLAEMYSTPGGSSASLGLSLLCTTATAIADGALVRITSSTQYLHRACSRLRALRGQSYAFAGWGRT